MGALKRRFDIRLWEVEEQKDNQKDNVSYSVNCCFSLAFEGSLLERGARIQACSEDSSDIEDMRVITK